MSSQRFALVTCSRKGLTTSFAIEADISKKAKPKANESALPSIDCDRKKFLAFDIKGSSRWLDSLNRAKNAKAVAGELH